MPNTRLETPLCAALGISIPIIQAPIGSATTPALAAAVSNAGGLGMLAVTWLDVASVRAAIVETRALTKRPFGVNIVLKWPAHDRIAACLEEGVDIVSLFWGDPGPYVSTIHGAKAKVMHTVASASQARQAADDGVDVIVAQGWEAGGHVWGEVATMPLVPCVVDAVSPLPVVAAGGIADGRGIAAALALGAGGVWVGTRFLMSDEAAVHPAYRERIVDAVETDTVYSTLFDGGWPDAPHRTLRNGTIHRWESANRPPSGQRPGENEVVALRGNGEPIARYSDTIPSPDMSGDVARLGHVCRPGCGPRVSSPTRRLDRGGARCRDDHAAGGTRVNPGTVRLRVSSTSGPANVPVSEPAAQISGGGA